MVIKVHIKNKKNQIKKSKKSRKSVKKSRKSTKKSRKSNKNNLTRWFNEKWVNVCKKKVVNMYLVDVKKVL